MHLRVGGYMTTAKCGVAIIMLFFLSGPKLGAQDFTLSVSSVTGFPGDSVSVGTFLDFPNAEGVVGFAFGVCSDETLVAIDCIRLPPCLDPNACVANGIIVMGEELAMVNGGAGPDLFAPATETADGFTVGCFVDFGGSEILPAQKMAEIAVARYRLIGPGGTIAPLTFCQTGNPMVNVVVGLAGGGQVTPDTIDGAITIADFPPMTDPSYALTVSNASGFQSDTVDISVSLDFSGGSGVSGGTFGVCSTPAIVDIDCAGGSGVPNDCLDNEIIVPGAALAATNGGNGPDTFVPTTTGTPFTGFTCSFLVDHTGAEFLSPQNEAELVVTTYEIIGIPGTSSPLTICSTNDPLTPATLSIVGGGTVIPEFVDGEVTVLVPSEPFRRGDCNGDGFINIADPIFLEQSFSSLAGTPVPDCIAACDFDDDGVVCGNDPIFGLIKMFGGGIQLDPGPLPAPFRDCGPDPTPDDLSCVNYDCAPPASLIPDPAYQLRLTDGRGSAGDTVQVSCLLDLTTGTGIEGWSWGVCHDPDFLEVQSVQTGMDAQGIFSFQARELTLANGWTVGTVVSLLAPGVGLELQVAEYLVLSLAPTEISYCDTLVLDPAAPPVSVMFSEEGRSVLPTTSTGVINGPLPPPVGHFRRGDADANGTFNGLIDGLFILNFQFVPGSPPPPCMRAADFDDDGVVNGIADALGALNFQFIMGSPPPSPPGHLDCGPDLTMDTLDCVDYPNCL